MGEVKIKSENLFDATTVKNVYLDSQGVEHSSSVSKTSDYISVTANTIYTLGMTGTSSSLNITSYCFYDSNKEFISSGAYQPSVDGNIVSITTPNNCAYFRFTYNQQRILVEFVRGVYNSFPPYFLNRPAHQVTNGQFVDIPTHHYVNGRWQGELTSQSPLKFWADGEMLDWRVEGKTSGNLWDGTFINTSAWGVSFSLDDEGYMVASSSSNDPREWGYAASQIKMTLGAGTYALVLQGIPPTQSWSGAMIYTSGGSALANNQNLVNKPLIIMPFTLTQETSIGIMVKVVNGKYRVQLLEGIYTSETIPPYEPYGGVGDWDETTQRYKIPVNVNGVTTNLFTDHQLMDGDSIDYTTTETTIPLATGNNTLTVDTAVKPSKVFVKFEG